MAQRIIASAYQTHTAIILDNSSTYYCQTNILYSPKPSPMSACAKGKHSRGLSSNWPPLPPQASLLQGHRTGGHRTGGHRSQNSSHKKYCQTIVTRAPVTSFIGIVKFCYLGAKDCLVIDLLSPSLSFLLEGHMSQNLSCLASYCDSHPFMRNILSSSPCQL